MAKVLGKPTQNPTKVEKFLAQRGPQRIVYGVYRPVGGSCPQSCSLMDKDKVSGFREEDGGALFRSETVRSFEARPDLEAWTYTHAWREAEVCQWRDELPSNVGVVASLNSPEEIPEAVLLGGRTVAVVGPTKDGKGFSDEEAALYRKQFKSYGNAESFSPLPCPAQRPSMKMGCADCKACMRVPPSKVSVILFASHGSGRKKAVSDCQSGCYAQHGNVNIHQKRSEAQTFDMYQWTQRLPYHSMVRLNISGDSYTEKDSRLPIIREEA